MSVRAAREAIDSTRWNPFFESFSVVVLLECWAKESLSARRTMTYFPDRKHFTCGMEVMLKNVVLMSGGGAIEIVYLRVRSGGDAIVVGASETGKSGKRKGASAFHYPPRKMGAPLSGPQGRS